MKIRYRQNEEAGLTHVVLADGAVEGISVVGHGDVFDRSLGIAIAMLKADAWPRLDEQSRARVERAFGSAPFWCWVVPDSVYGLVIRYQKVLTRALIINLVREVRGGKSQSYGLLVDKIGRALLKEIDEELQRYSTWPEYACQDVLASNAIYGQEAR